MQSQPINTTEYEILAHQLLEPGAWDYFVGGSNDEVTLQANCLAYKRLQIRPRLLVDVRQCELERDILGVPVSMPLGIAPLGAQGLAHLDGDLALARAAEATGTLLIVSCMANTCLEDVAQGANGPLWFQLYNFRERSVTIDLVQRAERAGYRALVLTIDTPVMGRRERDIHNGFGLPPELKMANFATSDIAVVPQIEAGASGFASHTQANFDAGATWEMLSWLRTYTSLPILLKGILTAEDALFALEQHVEGIIVSNHGGRQLDTVPASIDALPEIVAAVAGRCEVYLDGGIRRGTDIFKALAYGAHSVFIGRPAVWGLAVNGEQGVVHVLELLRAELELTMKLAGRPTLSHIDASAVQPDYASIMNLLAR